MSIGFEYDGKIKSEKQVTMLLKEPENVTLINLITDKVSDSNFPLSITQWLQIGNYIPSDSQEELDSLKTRFRTAAPNLFNKYKRGELTLNEETFIQYRKAWKLSFLNHKLVSYLTKVEQRNTYKNGPQYNKKLNLVTFLGKKYVKNSIPDLIQAVNFYWKIVPGYPLTQAKFPITEDELIALYKLIDNASLGKTIPANPALQKIEQVNPVWANAIKHKSIQLQEPDYQLVRTAYYANQLIYILSRKNWLPERLLKKSNSKSITSNKKKPVIKNRQPKKETPTKTKENNAEKQIVKQNRPHINVKPTNSIVPQTKPLSVTEFKQHLTGIPAKTKFPFDEKSWKTFYKTEHITTFISRNANWIPTQMPDYYAFLTSGSFNFNGANYKQNKYAWEVTSESLKPQLSKATHKAHYPKQTTVGKRSTLEKLNNGAGKKRSKVNTKANISRKKKKLSENSRLVRQEERRMRKSRNRLTYYDDQTYMDYLPVNYPSTRSRHNDGGGWS